MASQDSIYPCQIVVTIRDNGRGSCDSGGSIIFFDLCVCLKSMFSLLSCKIMICTLFCMYISVVTKKQLAQTDMTIRHTIQYATKYKRKDRPFLFIKIQADLGQFVSNLFLLYNIIKEYCLMGYIHRVFRLESIFMYFKHLNLTFLFEIRISKSVNFIVFNYEEHQS